jgi:DNA-binding NarL/FixJ family response regulator
MINILIADDHTMFADGIESILKDEKEISSVKKCFDGKSVMEILSTDTIDIILLDVNLPDMSGIEVCKLVTEKFPKVKVLAISMFNEESYVSEILNNGAKGYILKNTGKTELLRAIKTIYENDSYFSKDVMDTIMKGLMTNQTRTGRHGHKEIPKISKREKEVLKLIIEEYTTQEIANHLFISLKTVESHRSSLLAKLNARNSAGLVRAAIENGLIE